MQTTGLAAEARPRRNTAHISLLIVVRNNEREDVSSRSDCIRVVSSRMESVRDCHEVLASLTCGKDDLTPPCTFSPLPS